ncbi:MAG: hypothetical protein GY853_09470 [PVC group bacterium]|nr:hypothetical protein [PVC group bacterium]
MKKTLYFEPASPNDEQKQLQHYYELAKRVGWEGQINDIIKLAEKRKIKLRG